MVQEDAVVVLDSMGVEIVLNPERAPDSTSWSIDTVPDLVIGHDESKGERYLFGFIAGAASLSDGRIVVADRQLPGVRMYDPAGAFVRQIGRVGEGPGEYTGVGGVFVLAGDTIAVPHLSTGRAIQVFGPGGDFVRALSPPPQWPELWEGRYGRPSIVSLFTDGTVLASGSSRDTPFGRGSGQGTAMVSEFSHRLVRIGPGGEVLADFGEHPSSRWIHYNNGPQPGFSYQAEGYLPQPLMATHETHLFLSDGDRFEVSVYDTEARLSRIIRKAHTPAVIPRTWTDTRWSELMEGIEPSSSVAWLRRLSPPDIPEHAPAIDRMLFDVLGNLWVRSNPPAQVLPPIWFVFDSAGVLQHSLRTDIDPLHIGADHFVSVLQNQYGVHAVAVHSLSKP